MLSIVCLLEHFHKSCSDELKSGDLPVAHSIFATLHFKDSVQMRLITLCSSEPQRLRGLVPHESLRRRGIPRVFLDYEPQH